VDDVLGVGGLEASCRLQRVAEDLLDGGRAARDELAEVLALEELRDDVRLALVGPHVVDGEDVGVIQGGHRLGLLLEAAEATRVA
jgi:hypothetical protein